VPERAPFELKPLSPEGIPKALERAERYRFLNEPAEAESICRDILRVEPDNQRALVTLLLALTDGFDEGLADAVPQAQLVLGKLKGEYEQAYYAGIVSERRAKARLKQGGPGSGYVAYGLLREAMDCYQRAEGVRPAGNDDALLRWNACARILDRSPNLGPAPEDRSEQPLE
jgi:tetratricopeptide (TPR) repeat protein